MVKPKRKPAERRSPCGERRLEPHGVCGLNLPNRRMPVRWCRRGERVTAPPIPIGGVILCLYRVGELRGDPRSQSLRICFCLESSKSSRPVDLRNRQSAPGKKTIADILPRVETRALHSIAFFVPRAVFLATIFGSVVPHSSGRLITL